MKSFLGKSVSFPMRPNGRGGLVLVENEDAVEDRIDDLNIEVTVPAGTEVMTEDRRIRVFTVDDLVIAVGDASGTIQARGR